MSQQAYTKLGNYCKTTCDVFVQLREQLQQLRETILTEIEDWVAEGIYSNEFIDLFVKDIKAVESEARNKVDMMRYVISNLECIFPGVQVTTDLGFCSLVYACINRPCLLPCPSRIVFVVCINTGSIITHSCLIRHCSMPFVFITIRELTSSRVNLVSYVNPLSYK